MSDDKSLGRPPEDDDESQTPDTLTDNTMSNVLDETPDEVPDDMPDTPTIPLPRLVQSVAIPEDAPVDEADSANEPVAGDDDERR